MTQDLFADDEVLSGEVYVPLAQKMRPKTLEEVVGQRHLLGPNQPLWRIITQKTLQSMVLWGPPGVGKTTLAQLIAHQLGVQFVGLSAVSAGVKEIKQTLERAHQQRRQGQHTLLFIDEIHRFNVAQQDQLLPAIESGLVSFIGATTENPSFALNKALLSRLEVYVLNSLMLEELVSLLQNAKVRYFSQHHVENDVWPLLAQYADGDGRRALNLLENLLQTWRVERPVRVDDVQHYLKQALKRFDKDGDQFYDQISALHKSVRGSDPDAALYWFMRMLQAGADPVYLARRLLRMAWEDIGLADPRAIQLANDAAETYERLGSPEGELALGALVLYLAAAPKSNAAYNAFNEAKAWVKATGSHEVPPHLRNAPTALMRQLGYGKTYRYAHDEPHAYAAGENYWPVGIAPQHFYHPTAYGLEQKIQARLAFLATLDKEAHT